MTHCKEKRGLMKSTKEFWSKKQFTDSSSMEQWMKTKQRIGEYTQYVYKGQAIRDSQVRD